jgi:phospholipase C
MSLFSRSFWRRRGLVVAAVSAVALGAAAVPAVAASASAAHHSSRVGNDGLGIRPGKIKHVWLIILENKSYDASFTGLNNNTYLWKTLPSQGVLLKNYYGTGHFSLDNYVSLVSGQATQPDTQADCPFYTNFAGSVNMKSAGRATPRTWATPTLAALRTAPEPSSAALRSHRRARPGRPPSPTRAARTRPTSTCPSTSRSRGLNRF